MHFDMKALQIHFNNKEPSVTVPRLSLLMERDSKYSSKPPSVAAFER